MGSSTYTLSFDTNNLKLDYFVQTLEAWTKSIEAAAIFASQGETFDILVESVYDGSTNVAIAITASQEETHLRIVHDIEQLNRGLQSNSIHALPKRTMDAASAFQRVRSMNPNVRVLVASPAEDFIIPSFDSSDGFTTVSGPTSKQKPLVSYGAIRGRVQSMSSRKGLKFTLYDHVFDKGVQCVVNEEMHDALERSWNKEVEVEGMISRDPDNGSPLSVRNIVRVELLPEAKNLHPSAYRGILQHLHNSGQDPIEVIREFRNG